MVRLGLQHETPAVRLAAARLAATRPLPRILHAMIDAAVVHPELELAAVKAVGVNREYRGIRWVLDAAAAHEDAAIRQAAVRATYLVGGRARPLIHEKLDAESGATRALAFDCFLMVARPGDEPLLQAWYQRHGESDPERAAKALRVAAELEAGAYEPAIPDEVPLGFPGL